MAFVEIPPEARKLMRALAGDPADRYIEQTLLRTLAKRWALRLSTLEEARAAFLQPDKCLAACLGHYAFLRRGRDRQELGEIALRAFQEAEASEQAPLLERTDGRSVWAAFEALCEQCSRKPCIELNYGPVVGLVELAQEIYRADGVGSIAQWVSDAILKTGRLESEFDRIVDIRGVGPKFASVFLRDVTHVLEIDDQVAPIDRMYLQPIDKWIRLAAPLILDTDDEEPLADWVLAGKIAKYARLSGTSGVRFNMGTSWLGSRETGDPQSFRRALGQLAHA